MKILAVDTSGFEGSAALSLEPRHVIERQLPNEGRRHAQTLVAEVDELLKQQGIGAADIDAVAVSIGPGSFTGLRVGVVFAKTFAWANETKLVAVDTFQAIAQQVSERPDDLVTVISDAQRQEVFVATYEWNGDRGLRQPVGAVRIEPVANALASAPASIWTGPGLDRFGKHFDSEELVSAHLRQLSAASVAFIGRSLLADGLQADIPTLEPLYLRRSYAEEKAAES